MTRYYYTEPIADRTQADVDARAYKAFFNLSDWERIYQNALFVNRVYYVLLNITIPFNAISEPNMASLPDVSNFNALIANINCVCEYGNLGLTLQKADWTAGKDVQTFNYANVNQWEDMLAVMLDKARGIASDLVFCGVANAGQERFFQGRWRSYKWAEFSPTMIYRPRTNVANCGRSYAMQSRFRRYAAPSMDVPSPVISKTGAAVCGRAQFRQNNFRRY